MQYGTGEGESLLLLIVAASCRRWSTRSYFSRSSSIRAVRLALGEE